MLLPATASPITLPIPVSTSICLNPPPAATMSRIPAIGGSERSSEVAELARGPCPTPTPKVNIATSTAEEQRDERGAEEVEARCARASSARSADDRCRRSGLGRASARRGEQARSPAWPEASARWSTSDGRRPAARRAASNGAPRRRADGRPSGRRSDLPNSGPATITVGIATRMPSTSVRPRSAPTASIAMSGPGCGGTRPCMTERPASVGMPIVISGSPERRATSR